MEVVVIGALGALAVGIAVAMLWQERHRAPEPEGAVVYGVEDALEFVWAGLATDTKQRLGRRDVRRMLEWELLYLQQPAMREGEAIVGGAQAAAFIQERAWAQGHSYEPPDIFEVLDLQAAYLAALGAVGGEVEEHDRRTDPPGATGPPRR